MRRVGFFLLLLLAACGNSGGGSGPVGPVAIVSITGPLPSSGGAFTLTFTSLPVATPSIVTVRLTATEGTPFHGCTSAAIEGNAVVVTATTVQGTSPATVAVGDALCFVTVVFPDGSEVTSSTPIVTVEGTSDPALDQDLDGIHDRCDPKTYDFEGDANGAQPSETTAADGSNTGFVVKDTDGDRVAHFANSSGSGVSYLLDRATCDFAHQDLTAYIDYDATASIAHVEFWSDGSWLGYGGAGLLLQVLANGELRLYQRVHRTLPATIGGLIPANGRIRVRLLKGAGNASSMHIDAWDGANWTDDHTVFPIADDRWFTGRHVALAEYGASLRGIERITVVPHLPAAALTVIERQEGGASWKVFQRDGSDRATIPVSFLYRANSAARIEARVVDGAGAALPGHDWGTHEAMLEPIDGGRGTLDVTDVPAGGNYDVEVRLVDATTDAALAAGGLSDVAVGDVYLCIGQSNMAGYSGNLAGATVPLPEVHLFHNSDTWVQAVEPCDASLFQRDRISFENPLHSLMLPFGRAMVEATDVPVGIIPAPLGGTNLHTQWQRNAADPEHRVTLYGSALRRAALQGGHPIRGMLWYQGESDALGGRTTAQYRADLEQLIAQYRGDLSAPDAIFLCVQLGTWSSGGFPHWTNIQEAERQVCLADERAALSTVVDQPRSDGIHYSVAGYQELGRRLAAQARVLVFGHVLDPLVELDEAVSVAGGTAIELRYDAPVTGGVASLYAVSDDAGAVAVTGISTSGSIVTLQLGRALATNALVRYGISTLPSGGWVKDAAGVPVPCFADVPVSP